MAVADKVYIATEKANVSETENKSLRIEGIAMVCNKPSRNKMYYTAESVAKAYKTLEGKPLLFNHNPDKVIGHVTKVEFADGVLKYEADVDPEEPIARKIKRGDIKNVSIGAMVEIVDSNIEEGYYVADVKEFLELSVVTIPGFADTTINLIEKFEGAQCEAHDGFGDTLTKIADTMTALGIRGDFVVKSKSDAGKLLTFTCRKLYKDGKYSLYIKVQREYDVDGKKDRVTAHAYFYRGDGKDLLKDFGSKTGGIHEVKDWLGDVKDEVEKLIKKYEEQSDENIMSDYAKEEKIDKRYQNPDGTFKHQRCPDDPPDAKPTAFCGCVNYMMNVKGKSLDDAKRICGYIRKKKYGGESICDKTDEIAMMPEVDVICDFLDYIYEERQEIIMKAEEVKAMFENYQKQIEDLAAKIDAIRQQLDKIIDEVKGEDGKEEPNEEPKEEPEKSDGKENDEEKNEEALNDRKAVVFPVAKETFENARDKLRKVLFGQ